MRKIDSHKLQAAARAAPGPDRFDRAYMTLEAHYNAYHERYKAVDVASTASFELDRLHADEACDKVGDAARVMMVSILRAVVQGADRGEASLGADVLWSRCNPRDGLTFEDWSEAVRVTVCRVETRAARDR